MSKIAIIQVRGTIGVRPDVKKTFSLLKLIRKNSCTIRENDSVCKGMLEVVKDYVTWGEIDEGTLKLLFEKRGRIVGCKPLTEEYLKETMALTFDQFVKEFIQGKKSLKNIPGLKPFFRLKPPIHGYERGGIKKSFTIGGALGYRKDKINELIRRMIWNDSK